MKRRPQPNEKAKLNSLQRPVVLPARRRWTFRAIALVTPLLLLATAEVFLRLSGYGYPTGFFLKQRINGREVLTDNRRFGQRFFPKELARTPQPVVLTPRKEPGTTRIIVFGESAAMGDPEPAFGLPRMLQAMLELKFPSNKFEVINTAMTAINSHVVREIARNCTTLEGDVWIVYMGNNEVIGPFGSGTIFGRRIPSASFIRAAIWLKQFRIAQLVGSLGRTSPADWQGMEMFLQHQVRRDDPQMRKVYAHFRENLKHIVRIGTSAGAQVVVSTVAVNLGDSPPFASQHRVPLTEAQRANWEGHFARGVSMEKSGRFVEAQAAFLKAQETLGASNEHPHAGLYFHLARCESALGQIDQARAHFNLAREYDTLRFRADGEINAAIRGCAASAGEGVRVVDAASTVASESSNGIPGKEFFYEHVHLTFEGNYHLARILFAEVVRALPASLTNQGGAPLPTLEDCARRLAWTDFNRLEVYEEMSERLKKPPFTSQFGYDERDRAWQKRMDDITERLTTETYQRLVAEYTTAVQKSPDDWVLHENFARLLEASGDVNRASDHWKEVMRLLPHDPQAYYRAGHLLEAGGRSGSAISYFREALRRDPALTEARHGLALALVNLGRMAEAQRELKTALRLNPMNAPAREILRRIESGR